VQNDLEGFSFSHSIITKFLPRLLFAWFATYQSASPKQVNVERSI